MQSYMVRCFIPLQVGVVGTHPKGFCAKAGSRLFRGGSASTPLAVATPHRTEGGPSHLQRCQETHAAVVNSPSSSSSSRRRLLLAASALLSAALTCRGGRAAAVTLEELPEALAADMYQLQTNAMEAYARRDFAEAVSYLNKLVEMAPQDPRWREMRAQALVDAKDFARALDSYDAALRLTPPDAGLDRARLLAGRGLAQEGISDWVSAIKDYDNALRLAAAAGQMADPYVLNSRGNCHASLGEWQAARNDYLASAELFQSAAGFHGPGGSTTPRLDGAVFAASNAALMLAQLGDEEGAIREMQAISRRAPGNADMRAALAALYWSQGWVSDAENEWEFACNRISAGCRVYQDEDWLFRIRRWPPIMVRRMRSFLALQSSGAVAAR